MKTEVDTMKKIFVDSFSQVVKNWKWWILCGFIDLIFLFLVPFTRSSFIQKGESYLYAVTGSISKFSIQYSSSENVGYLSLLMESGAYKWFLWFLIVLLVWLAVLYFIFTFFNSLNWFILNKKIFKKKIMLSEYSIKFFKVNIVWFIIYGIFNAISYLFSFGLTVSSDSEGVVKVPFVFSIIFAIGIYFAFISYALLIHKEKHPIKQSFILGYKKARTLLPILLIVVVGYFLLDYLLKGLFLLHPLFMLLSGLLLLPLVVTFMRALFQITVDLLSKKK